MSSSHCHKIVGDLYAFDKNYIFIFPLTRIYQTPTAALKLCIWPQQRHAATNKCNIKVVCVCVYTARDHIANVCMCHKALHGPSRRITTPRQ